MRQIILLSVLICFWLQSAGSTQTRFGDEDPQLKGFTKSSGEHIINELPGILEVRSVKGVVVDEAAAPLSQSIFEVRPKDPNARVLGARTNDRGQFKIGRVPEGLYVFKLTRDGFQSIIGKVKITRTANPQNTIRLVMKVGV